MKYAQCDGNLSAEALAFVAGAATSDRKWYDLQNRLPVPTEGDDYLVAIENNEERYAYAWYAYDRQCFICYATGLSLGNGVRFYKPIIGPQCEVQQE